MPQFFLPAQAATKDEFHLEGPEAFHIVRVLRHKEGDELALFDGKGGQFEGVITRIGEDGSVKGNLKSRPGHKQKASAEIYLYQGLLKASHWEYVLEKATELGVTKIIPVLTPRTVVLLREAERAAAKQERWQRIVLTAAKQCGTSVIPQLDSPIEFRDAVRQCQGQGATLVAWEGLKGAPAGPILSQALRGDKGPQARVNIFIGPEGGFSDEEIELAESLETTTLFGLGHRILRAETAALTACALVQYELGQL